MEIQLNVDVSINERDFYQTDPQYATFPYVSFDGINFHVVFLVTTPTMAEAGQKQRAEVVTRLVMPLPAVLATIEELQKAVSNPVAEGIYAPLYESAKQAADDADTDRGSSTAEAERDE